MSKTCFIVGASKDSLSKFDYDSDDYIIASDGGYTFLKENNYPIDLVIGDFDSLGYVPNEKEVTILPKVKDVSDLHASIIEGYNRGYTTFKIFGCLGGRSDHTLATIQDSYGFSLKGLDITLFNQDITYKLLCNNKIEIYKERGYISIFSLSESSLVTIKNLKYEVEDKLIKSDFPLGLSNEFIGKKSSIKVENGCILIIY